MHPLACTHARTHLELCPWTTVPYARSMACCTLEPAGVRPNPHPYVLPMPAQTHAAATAVVGLGYMGMPDA